MLFRSRAGGGESLPVHRALPGDPLNCNPARFPDTEGLPSVTHLPCQLNARQTAARPSHRGVWGALALRSGLVALATLWLACCLPTSASAQSAEMSLSTINRDRGLHSGEFVLHPALQLMGHHDTNLFNGNDVVAGNAPVGATSIRLMPKLSLQNDQTGNATFLFNSAADARMYLVGDQDPTSRAVSKQAGVGANVGLDFTYGNNRPFAISLFDHFTRQLRASLFETSTTLHRNNNEVGGRIEFHPGDNPLRRPFNIAFIGAYEIG